MKEDVGQFFPLAPILTDTTNTRTLRLLLFSSSSSSQSESSSDDTKSEKRHVSSSASKAKKLRRYNYINSILPNYSDLDFQNQFKMTRNTVEVIISKFGNNWNKLKGRTPVPFEKSLLLTLWYLVTLESYREISERFNISKGNIQRVIVKVCILIYEKRKEYIKWLQGITFDSTVEKFNVLHGSDSFPNVFGCVGSTHIKIDSPQADESYYDDQSNCSIKAQATCNSDLLFTHVYVGWPGVAKDSQIWENNPLNKFLTTFNPPDPGKHILGDGAYPISDYIMVPYKEAKDLSPSHKLFNERLNKTRVCIDQAFGRLKGIFKRLRYLNMHKLENVKFVVITCFVLHNLILLKKDESFKQNDNVYDYKIQQFTDDDSSEAYPNRDYKSGKVKRDNLMKLLFQNI